MGVGCVCVCGPRSQTHEPGGHSLGVSQGEGVWCGGGRWQEGEWAGWRWEEEVQVQVWWQGSGVKVGVWGRWQGEKGVQCRCVAAGGQASPAALQA